MEPHKIKGVIYSSKSYEIILHVPSEYDYHYIVAEHMDKMLYFLYLCKQLNDPASIELLLVKTVLVSQLGRRVSLPLRSEGKREERRRVQKTRRHQPHEGGRLL